LLKGFFVPLLVSPLVALGLAFVVAPLVTRIGRWLDARCLCGVPAPNLYHLTPGGSSVAPSTLKVVVDRAANCEGRSLWSWNFSADQAHWVSSALVSLSRAMNDAPKIWALVFPLLLLAGAQKRLALAPAIALVVLTMGAGSWVAGYRVTEVLAERVTRMNHHEGLAANLTTAFLVVGASRLGLPVSTTHVSSGAIVGVGLGQSGRGIDWRVFGQMAMAWLVTLPAAAGLAMACYRLLR
jgi:PiT family inorganic phosphate transporter